MTLKPFPRYATPYGVQRFVNDLYLDPQRTAIIFTLFLPKSERTEPRGSQFIPLIFRMIGQFLSKLQGRTDKRTNKQTDPNAINSHPIGARVKST